MSSLTGRKHGQQGSAGEGAGADHAPAVGKRTLVETAMATMGRGAPMPADVRGGVEAETGGDLSSATVHAGPEASQMAGDLGARAFTFGSQVVLGDGAHMDDSQLLAHEATHVVQQAGRTPSVMRDTGSRQQTSAEIEADRVADLVNRGAATDRESTAPRAFPAPSGSKPQQRHDAAVARLQLIETSIGAEDGTPADRTTVQTKDDSQPGRHTVSHQLAAGGTRQAALDARTASAKAVAGKDLKAAAAAAGALEVAVRAYQDAYERTYLVSTDKAIDKKAKWEPTKQRDRLGSTTVQERLETWANTLPYVKFVVPAGNPTEVYVGDPALGHIDIANDNALAAGLLKIKTDPLRVSEIENASGGYRPGPLRNALVLARMIELGYVQDDLRGTQVDHRPDGSYSGSKLRPPRP
ncbi:MAG TPA: DUF4157 domain-containing protein [Kofleriaceae bacterium]|nr:DUF4157 domain-containing protein [Kofleriaceae bacterium]